jgi:hypothetical protein
MPVVCVGLATTYVIKSFCELLVSVVKVSTLDFRTNPEDGKFTFKDTIFSFSRALYCYYSVLVDTTLSTLAVFTRTLATLVRGWAAKPPSKISTDALELSSTVPEASSQEKPEEPDLAPETPEDLKLDFYKVLSIQKTYWREHPLINNKDEANKKDESPFVPGLLSKWGSFDEVRAQFQGCAIAPIVCTGILAAYFLKFFGELAIALVKMLTLEFRFSSQDDKFHMLRCFSSLKGIGHAFYSLFEDTVLMALGLVTRTMTTLIYGTSSVVGQGREVRQEFVEPRHGLVS